jgi:hypothetical protein
MAIYIEPKSERLFCQFDLNRKTFKKHLPLGTTREEAEAFERSWRKRLITSTKPKARCHNTDANGVSIDVDIVYVMRVRQFYKIGYTTDIRKRYNDISVSNPFKVTLMITIVSEAAQLLESQLHERFAAKRVRGEWFRLDEEDLAFLRELAREGHPATILPESPRAKKPVTLSY